MNLCTTEDTFFLNSSQEGKRIVSERDMVSKINI